MPNQNTLTVVEKLINRYTNAKIGIENNINNAIKDVNTATLQGSKHNLLESTNRLLDLKISLQLTEAFLNDLNSIKNAD